MRTNDITKLYDIDIRHHQTLRGTYVCPVCGGTYANKETFTTHLGRMDCYDIEALVSNTMLEDVAFKWFVEVTEADKGRSVYNVAKFRKNRSYKTYVQATIFCIQNEEKRLMQYLAFMMLVRNYKHVGSAIRNMQKESNLREFRLYLHANDEIDDTDFSDMYREELENDHHFLIRSLERAHLSVSTLLKWDIEKIFEEMPLDYKERVQKILDVLPSN